jgi:hypothetical protein
MDVQIYVAKLVVEGVSKNLTKTVAKQFPILPRRDRWDAATSGQTQPKPICKVNGKTLSEPSDWLYLVEDKTAGLAWVVPAIFHTAYTETVLERGGWVDHPEEVPTIIL